MSREKQIEEMARDICECFNNDGTCYQDDKPCDFKCECFTDAQYLYDKGYRKQIEAENMAMYPTSAFECSLCGWSNWDLATGDGTYKYCPNCGAKMKGANNEN